MLSQAELDYHLRQYAKPYESTIALGRFVAEVAAPSSKASALDVGCGAGANIHHLSKMLGMRWSGLDSSPQLLAVASERNPDVPFLIRDFLEALPKADFVFSIQVLSFIEDWRPALAQLLAASGMWCFVTSLFWEGVRTHTHVSDAEHTDAHYNVIDSQDFTAAVREGGGTVVERTRFVASGLRSGRYSLGSRTEDGYTFSGPLYLPWGFYAIRK